MVTGGTSGLGRILAEAFAAAGARLVVAGLEPEGVVETVEQMTAAGFDVFGVPVDITRQEDVDCLFDDTIRRFGRLDALVNNAGRSMRGKVMDTTPEQFQSLWDLNVLAMIRCTRAAMPHLLLQRGHVVNIGSLAAKAAAKYVGAYPVTKHAVAAYSQQLRLELGEEGLHVLLVCPGPISRAGQRLYRLEGEDGVPETARGPGAGVKVRQIDPQWLAARILQACEKRQPELVVPAKAKLLFAVAQLWPTLGDWLVLKNLQKERVS